MLGIVFIFVFASFVPAVNSSIQKQKENEKTISIKIFDSGSSRLNEYYVCEGDARRIIALIEKEISQESFTEQIEEKLNVLNDIGIISSETANNLANKFNKQQKLLDKDCLLPGITPLFNLFNLFNGLFFGLKGERTFNSLDLPVYKFPFFNSNITALFSIYSKFIGRGCIFTLGTLGFKYIYEFDMDKYEFPHFPEISGSIIGFTGIFLKLSIDESIEEEYEGTYFIGIGMNIASAWNNLE